MRIRSRRGFEFYWVLIEVDRAKKS
ncbi:unnamed protein product [Rhodiola kirilowii]